MSFALGFAPDAKSQWLELDVELQEVILDALDKLADDASRISGGVFSHKLTHQRAGVHHYVVLRAIVDQAAHTITLIGIQDHTSNDPLG